MAASPGQSNMRKRGVTAKKLSVFVPAVAISAFLLSLLFLALLWILTACLVVVCLCAYSASAVLGLCSYCFSLTDIALCSSLYCYLLVTLRNSDGDGKCPVSSVDRLDPNAPSDARSESAKEQTPVFC